MANGDTRTNNLLDIAAHGTRADLPAENCCNTRTQSLIVDVAERIMDVEDEVEEIKNNPDVADIVATYADLQSYDTSHLTDKDVIRVLADETHDGQSTYYRWDAADQEFDYIGTVGDYYTKTQVDGLLDGKQDVLTAGENITIEDESGSLVISSTGGSNYTAGDGIDITNAVISATNTGKAKVLTTDDYNYPTDNPDGVALWLLQPGIYTVESGTKWYLTNSLNYSTGTVTAILSLPTSNMMRMLYNRSDGDWYTQSVNITSGVRADSGVVLSSASVVDNLTSTFTNAPLSANQGKVLKDMIDALPTGGGITELTSADYNYPTDNPTYVGLWLLPDGLYYKPSNVVGRPYVGGDDNGWELIIVQTYGTYKEITCIGGNLSLLSNGKTKGLQQYETNPTTGSYISGHAPLVDANLSQSTGTSTTSVMSQNAVTSMVFAEPLGRKVQIGNGADATGTLATAVGRGAVASGRGAIALGAGANASAQGQFDVSATNSTNNGYNSSSYRLLTGLYDPQSAHDAATKGYVDSAIMRGSSDPTDATAGSIGQLYQNTVNGNVFVLLQINVSELDPEDIAYDWERLIPESEIYDMIWGETSPRGGSSAPTQYTDGDYGKIYIDYSTNTAYMCVGIDDESGEEVYTWRQITS